MSRLPGSRSVTPTGWRRSVAASFQTSLTQHDPPIAFPYGFSFYAVLTPFARLAGSPVEVVRFGAAASGVVAVMATYAIAARASVAAGLAAALLFQFLPWSFVVFPNGNLSNVFGQATSLVFLAWWTRSARSAWPVGAVLLAVSCLAHLSSLFMLAALVAVAFGMTRFEGRPFGRDRALAVTVGLGVTAAYYALFIPLVLDQAPRLLGGGGREESALGEAVWHQLLDAALLLGAPALALAWVGRPRASGEPDAGLRRWWVAGTLLGLLAVLTGRGALSIRAHPGRRRCRIVGSAGALAASREPRRSRS